MNVNFGGNTQLISVTCFSSLQLKIFSLKSKPSALNSRVLGKQLHCLGFSSPWNKLILVFLGQLTSFFYSYSLPVDSNIII